ncbi:MAG: YeeE/YedE family protein, partial [Syntrophaceae bacterium]|nr:YeeE/YedE family protein [Syntrophaceae bacterium]
VGAGTFAEVYTFIKDSFLKWGDLGKLTLPKVIGVNHWIIIAILWVIMLAVLMALEKKKL